VFFMITVLGTIGGTKYGIAKKANLISVKVLNSRGSGSIADVIDGIGWVVNRATLAGSNRAVINMSLGTSRVNGSFNRAADNAVQAGVTVVVAGGNGSRKACKGSPASADDVITVGATANDDRKASFSNFGSCIDIFAPGVNIESCSILQGSHSVKSGTSMASPHVAGVAALLLQDSDLAPAEIAQKLRDDAIFGVVVKEGKNSPNLMLYTGAITGPSDPTSAPSSTPSAPTSAPTSAPSASTSAPTSATSTAPVEVPTIAPSPSCTADFASCNVDGDCCSDKCKRKGDIRFCREGKKL
jgi:subtilisin family serine protease